MRRRDVLKQSSGALALAVAGCLGSASGGTPPVDDGELETFDPAGTTEEFSIGDEQAGQTQPHSVEVWNATETDVTCETTVETGAGTVLDEAVDLPADRQFTVRIHDPADYTVELAVRDGPQTLLAVPERQFDCNASSTLVAIRNSEFDSMVASTLAEC